MQKNYILLKNLHLIIGTTQYCDTQQTIHNTKYIVAISFPLKYFWSFLEYGLFELDWFWDRRQLNSLLTATENG